MSKRKLPPSERRPRSSHEELQQAVLDCDSMLRATWARHIPDDLMVLADLRRPECVPQCVKQHGQEAVDRVLREAAATGTPSWLAYKQHGTPFIEGMLHDGDEAHRLCALELQGFRRLGVVPLLVVVPGGLWATQWSDKPNVFIRRYDPATGRSVQDR